MDNNEFYGFNGKQENEDNNKEVVQEIKEVNEEIVQNKEIEEPVNGENNYYKDNAFDNKVQREPEVIVDNTDKSKKKKPKVFARLCKRVGAAALVGVIAGGACYGTMYAGYLKFPVKTSAEASDDVVNAVIDELKKNGVLLTDNRLLATNASSDDNKSAVTTVLDVSDMVDKVISSVVAITGTVTTTYDNFFGFWGGTQSYESPCSGSGIIIGQNDTELLVVTNSHVVSEVNNLKVNFCDGSSVDAVVKGTKPESDLAVVAVPLDNIELSTFNSISVAKLGSSSDIRVGEAAIAIGNAAGYGISVTTGCVSAVGRSLTIENVSYTNLIQTDAAINPGNSGGALFNAAGEVIGINSAKMSSTSIEGMGYAISVDSVMDIIDNLSTQITRKQLSEDERGYLGINGTTVNSQSAEIYGLQVGVLIRNVTEGSAAMNAGLQVRDILTSFDGKSVDSMDRLRDIMSYYEVGETVEVEYYHLEDGEYVQKTAIVTLTAKPES